MLFWALSAGTTTFLSCIVDNGFAILGSLKTDVALALIDLLKTSRSLTTLTEDQCLYLLVLSIFLRSPSWVQRNFKVIIPICGKWFRVLGAFRKDITQRFVFDDG